MIPSVDVPRMSRRSLAAGLLLLAAGLASPGCGRSRGSRGAEAPDPSGVFSSLSYTQAIDEARAGNRLVMLDVYTDWCGWCKKMDRETFADRRVREALKDFVALKVNAEKGGRAVAERYEVRGYPTILFISPDGRVVRQVRGYVNADEMLRVLASLRSPA
jgi:thiol:disulfide interchange protein